MSANLAKLPAFCFAELPSTGETIRINAGESGYYAVTSALPRGFGVDAINAAAGVTVPQRMAMESGSMFGWELPAANPDIYNADGTLNKAALARVRRAA